jgi:hypothetical protein
MKMIIDALPNKAISFLTKCCPTSAATVATVTKYSAARIIIVIVQIDENFFT